jgi:hypothetical protein
MVRLFFSGSGHNTAFSLFLSSPACEFPSTLTDNKNRTTGPDVVAWGGWYDEMTQLLRAAGQGLL